MVSLILAYKFWEHSLPISPKIAATRAITGVQQGASNFKNGKYHTENIPVSFLFLSDKINTVCSKLDVNIKSFNEPIQKFKRTQFSTQSSLLVLVNTINTVVQMARF